MESYLNYLTLSKKKDLNKRVLYYMQYDRNISSGILKCHLEFKKSPGKPWIS